MVLFGSTRLSRSRQLLPRTCAQSLPTMIQTVSEHNSGVYPGRRLIDESWR